MAPPSCTACHVAPAGFAAFSCTTCHEHGRLEMAKEHRKVRAYAHDSPACVRCHPNGRKDEAEDD